MTSASIGRRKNKEAFASAVLCRDGYEALLGDPHSRSLCAVWCKERAKKGKERVRITDTGQ